MKLSEILRAGKQRIETLGWGQGDDATIYSPEPKCCTVTAIMGVPDANLDERDAALTVLKEAIGVDLAVNWNDEPARTLPEVLAAYDKAIAAAEAQEQTNG